MNEATAGEREFVMTRVFHAPRKLVWRAWTECEQLQHWWGPQGWALTYCRLDLRPEGVWHYCMTGPGPDGGEMESWGRAVYQEIVAPERLVYRDAFSDADGNVVASMPEMTITVTFEELGEQTRMVSRTLFASRSERDAVLEMGAEPGMNETLDRLEEFLRLQQVV